MNNLLEGIEQSKATPFDQILFGLGIRYVGRTVAKKLAKHFKDIESLAAASQETLISVHEIGERIAISAREWFADERNQKEIERLREAGLNLSLGEGAEKMESERLAGKSFVISGVFAQFSRDELKAKIEANGGRVISAVSGKLSYLLAGEGMGPAKLAKAEKLKVEVISEEDFLKMLG